MRIIFTKTAIVHHDGESTMFGPGVVIEAADDLLAKLPKDSYEPHDSEPAPIVDQPPSPVTDLPIGREEPQVILGMPRHEAERYGKKGRR